MAERTPAPVVSWQIVTKDPAGAARFYGQLFGWRIDAGNALGYREVTTGTGPGTAGGADARGLSGGIWPAPPDGGNLVQLFVGVDDVAAAVARAQELGARVLVPPAVLPDGDEMAILLDPAGLSFGVVRRAAARASATARPR